MADVWTAFNRIACRRQSGTVANPVTYTEIEAFNRLTMAGLGPWEVDLICRVDDVVLRTITAKAASGEAGETNLIPFSDGEGVKAFMTRLTIQHNARLAAQKPKGG